MSGRRANGFTRLTTPAMRRKLKQCGAAVGSAPFKTTEAAPPRQGGSIESIVIRVACAMSKA